MEKEYIINSEEQRKALITKLENERIIAGIENEVLNWFDIEELPQNELELINAFLCALKNGGCDR